MGTNCAPLVADLNLFCYEEDFMMSLSDDKQADIIDALNTTSNINIYFDDIVSQIYPAYINGNTSDTEVSILDLQFFISNDMVSTEVYDKGND